MGTSRRSFLTMAGAAAGSWYLHLDALGHEGPLAIYPAVERRVHEEAARRARVLTTSLDLAATDAVFVPSLDELETTHPQSRRQQIGPDGLLTFAVDVPRTTWVSGQLTLEPPADLRPGLRASVLCDTTLVGAPMCAADEWGVREITDPAPRVQGAAPAHRVALASWLLPKGRRYLTVAGPGFRPAGAFVSLTLHALDRRVDEPLYQFAFITDTHVRRSGREDWMNRKMGEASAPELLRTLQQLATEGIAFVIHGGDLTEKATRDEFLLMRDVLAAQSLPVYACIGNHDRYLASSRFDARELLAAHFPGGELDYVFRKPPLRFIVMDVALEDEAMRASKVQWLHDVLAADTVTPTIFVWHYPLFNRGGVSWCGFRLQDWSELGRMVLLDVLRRTPNVMAAINGHDHWDEVNTVDGFVLVQNAAFVEWPNTYRLYRVYADRLEWEVRQVRNRGFVRESFLSDKAMSWMIATREGDLAGVIPFSRRPL